MSLSPYNTQYRTADSLVAMESVKNGKTLIPTPKWFIGLRIAQIVVSLVIVGLAGVFVHGYYDDPLGIAIASGVFTWIIALYVILTEHAAGCRSGYNTWAVLSLDFFMIVLWLASLGANAAFRSSFVVPVNAQCYDDGSLINSGQCTIYKRAVATELGLDVLSAIAGISAIMLLLFVATFSYVAHFFRLEWAKYSSDNDVEKNSVAAAAPTAVPVGQPAPFMNQQQEQQQPQWAQQLHQQTPYPPEGPAYGSYAPQNPGYAGAQDGWNQPAAQELHSPHGTPAPGQPYYPPQ
ncbi:hypothetical protein GGS21DRAFT_498188 [Xylaria nigripes]|nr:hypothetical protein GGS21DRAFT_498188 [Xylaria nigripes]